MEVIEAKIILRCQTESYVKEIWRRLNFNPLTGWRKKNYSYPQVAQRCEELWLKGHLLRWKRGTKMYYRATKQAMLEAVKLANEQEVEKQREVEALKMMMTNRRITNFV